ncbi:androgen-dependent TFPI-regulating protein-like [Pectinophora gossypiella]|uniref:androgen-dependent TFPI-regulating protein-like n=1 Tax=Pectinophora gossypiella TaxID=13191 RepID=UPI00214EF83A|nr:androgen-dependent TFPI-regulating protein-like [Pectinophora gossypiella]
MMNSYWENKVPAKFEHSLIKLRLWFYIIALVHLALISWYLLVIVDFSTSDDQNIRKYNQVRWRLLTTWFNLLFYIHLPVSVYCEWKALRGEASRKHVQILNDIRSTSFSSILLPTATFADLLFWRLWYKNPVLLAPMAILDAVPFWSQHCTHTVSLIVVIMDILLVPRQTPRSLKNGSMLLAAFVGTYTLMFLYSIAIEDEYIYSFTKTFSYYQLATFVLYMFAEHLFYFTSQWIIVDMLWGNEKNRGIYKRYLEKVKLS